MTTTTDDLDLLQGEVGERAAADGVSLQYLPLVHQVVGLTVAALRDHGRILPVIGPVADDLAGPERSHLRDTLVVLGQLWRQSGPKGWRTARVVGCGSDDSKVVLGVVETERPNGRTGHQFTVARTELAGPDFELIGFESGIDPGEAAYDFPPAEAFTLEALAAVSAAWRQDWDDDPTA